MPNNPFQNAETFNDAVVQELKNKSVKTLGTHVRDLVLRSVTAIQKVYVDPDDSPEEMVAAIAELLQNTGNAVASGEITVEFETDELKKLTGSFVMELPIDSVEGILPSSMIARSGVNQARKALRNVIS